MCMLQSRQETHSNHAPWPTSPLLPFGLSEKDFKNQFSIGDPGKQNLVGEKEPPYLRHNLYEEEVARATLSLPEQIFQNIKDTSIAIERRYEETDLSSLPKACLRSEYS